MLENFDLGRLSVPSGSLECHLHCQIGWAPLIGTSLHCHHHICLRRISAWNCGHDTTSASASSTSHGTHYELGRSFGTLAFSSLPSSKTLPWWLSVLLATAYPRSRLAREERLSKQHSLESRLQRLLTLDPPNGLPIVSSDAGFLGGPRSQRRIQTECQALNDACRKSGVTLRDLRTGCLRVTGKGDNYLGGKK